MQRFNINWTAKALVNQMEKGKVNYDNAVQRNLVWDVEKKSLLIHSMIYGYAIPAMYFTRDEDGIYDSLDGKQRSNAISEFLHDEFALSTDTPTVVDDNGCVEDVSGLYFSQLPEWARDRIKDYNLTIYYEGMTETEVREFFRRLNNGKPLSAIELTRANVPCLTIFQQLARHKAIQFMVSEAGRKRFTDEMIAMQLYQLITEEYRYMVDAVGLSDIEAEYFGLNMERYRGTTDEYTDTPPSSTGDNYSSANPWDAPGMGVPDFI